jgi:hypothetical protein
MNWQLCGKIDRYPACIKSLVLKISFEARKMIVVLF